MSGDAITRRRGGAESCSWPRVRLGEVCEVLIGNSAPQEASCFEGGTYPFVRTSDVGGIHFGILNCSRDMLNDAGVKGLRFFRKGSILFPKSGASAFLNHRVMLGIDAFVSSHLAVIEPSENVEANYLLHYLTTVDTKNLLQNSAYPSLRRGDIAAIPLHLPPLAEQRRIASKLDRLCDIVTKRKAQLSQLQKLVKSRFVEMFGEPENNPKGFPLLRMDDVVSFHGGSQPDKKYFEYEPTEDNVRLIQIRDYRTDRYKTYIPRLLAKRHCNPDDIMIGRYGPPIFQIFKGLEGAYNVAMMKAVPKMGNREFIRAFLKQDCLRHYLEGFSKRTAGQDGIQMDKLKAYPFPYPPIELQDLFAEFEAKVDKLAFAVRKSLESAEKLYRQQLSEAFA